MPPLQAIGWPRDPMWRNILAQLVDEVSRGKNVPAEAIEVCAALRRAVDEDPESLEDLAEAVLAEQDQGVDSAAAPFVMAALQPVRRLPRLRQPAGGQRGARGRPV
ncbi:hypothetical protein G6F22_020127 [Rhizopus arrhizus]|nr:hypothetical protein G6F22_020127 [Rhizopus arrhizus]